MPSRLELSTMAAPLRVSAGGPRGRPGGAAEGTRGTSGLSRLRLRRAGRVVWVRGGVLAGEGVARDGMGVLAGGGPWLARC